MIEVTFDCIGVEIGELKAKSFFTTLFNEYIANLRERTVLVLLHLTIPLRIHCWK